MPRELPLYRDKRLPVETERPLKLNHDCTRCRLGEQARNVCLPAAGQAGGVLVIGDWPGKYEDASGEPFSGRTGVYVKGQVKHHWKGPVAYDYAVRCTPGKKPPDNARDKCRPYMTQTIKDVNPERVIVLGPQAAASVFGESVPVLSLHHGIGWLYNDGKPIPVFILLSPTMTLRNTFLSTRFERDMKWALTCDLNNQWKPPYDAKAYVIDNAADAQEAIDECYEAGGMTYDIETVGRVADRYFEIISLAVTPYGTDDAWVWDGDAMLDKRLTNVLRDALANALLPKTGSNVKYDHAGAEEVLGMKVRGSDTDTRLQRKLLYSDVSGKLRDMAYMVAMGGHKREMARALTAARKSITAARKKSGKAVGFLPGVESPVIEEAVKTTLSNDTYAYGLVPEELLLRYNALDSVSTDRMRRWLAPQMERQPQINAVWKKITCRTIEAVTQLERWGMPVDRQAIMNYDVYLGKRLDELAQNFKKYKVLPSSTQQMAKLLYEEFQLPILSTTDTGQASTDKGALERILSLTRADGLSKGDLKQAQTVVQTLLDYRAIGTLRGTFAAGMLDHIRDDGRIHPSLNLDGASSGRTSCSGPNLQNIPRGSNAYAAMARSCFMATPGRRILQLDYSQLEYRIAAMMSGDPVMIAMFMRGEDFHTGTARLIARDFFKVDPAIFDLLDRDYDSLSSDEKELYNRAKEMRSQAKTFNFGLMYGMTDGGLAKRMGCSKAEAAKIRATIMGKWTALAAWFKARKRETEDSGYAWTWWDGEPARRRPLWLIGNTGQDEKASGEKRTAENSTGNTPIQGTASDFCIASLVECIEWLQGTNLDAKLVISIHDSLMFDVAEDDLGEVAETAHDIMVSHNADGLPLVVDIEEGPSWGALQKYDLTG